MAATRRLFALARLALPLVVVGGAALSLAGEGTDRAIPVGAQTLGQHGQPVASSGNAPHSDLVVSGSVQDLWPGVAGSLNLTVTNVGHRPIRLLTLGAVAEGPHGCTASENLRISAYDASSPGAGEYLIPGRRSVVVPLQITLLDLPENQRFCEGATFRLTYHGSAEGMRGRP